MLEKNVFARMTISASGAAAAVLLCLGATGAAATTEFSAAAAEPVPVVAPGTKEAASTQGFTEALCDTWLGSIAPKAVCGDDG